MRFAIVGGGLLGMTAAWNLIRSGNQVTIFEGAERCGGLTAPWDLGGVTWDRHYHVTLYSDLALRQLLRELGLEDEMRWVKTGTGFYVRGALHPFSSLLDYAAFPTLSPVEKVRLAAAILTASRISNWRPLERVTAVEWLTRQCGRTTVEKIWLPLLRAKVGADAERVSAAFIWAIIARMYAARRTNNKRELFGYARGGYDRVLRRFEQQLTARGTEIRTSCGVQRVESRDGGVVVTTDSESRRFDRALVTLAAPLAARICPQLTNSERALNAGVEYQGIVCASVLTRSPLSPYYITNIADASVPFTGVIEMTALVDRAELGGHSLVYLPKYVGPNDPALQRTDAEIESSFLTALERMHPIFSRSDVRAFRISRVRHVFPIPTLDYSKRLPPIRTSVPGVFTANSAHIVNGTLNVNETVKLANSLTPELIASPVVAARMAAVA